MELFDKLERYLERGVNGAFAKVFRAEVQPVEITSAMRRSIDDHVVSTDKSQRLIVPNLFIVELSTSDFDTLVTEYEADFADELIASTVEHVESQHYQLGGPVSVQFTKDNTLVTGVFRLRSSIARQVQPVGSKSYDGRRSFRVVPMRSSDNPYALQRVVEAPHGVGDSRWQFKDGFAQDYAEFDGPPCSTDSRPVADHRSTLSSRTPLPRSTVMAHAVGGLASGSVYRAEHRLSPAVPRKLKQRPWLNIEGERYPLIGAISIIGRDDDVDIMLDDPRISRKHSEIRVTFDGPHLVMSIRDLCSTNGTYVNGDLIDSTHLHDDDHITVGCTRIIIHGSGSR